MKKIIYKFGELFGNCAFLNDTKTVVQKTNRTRYRRYALFKCSCGKEFESLIDSVKYGRTRSCGCMFIEQCSIRLPKPNIKHGESLNKQKSPEYSTWLRMKSRCKEESNSKKWYFDKGIKVCKEWVNSFETFLQDMGRKPSKYHSIDRIDGNKGYYKENCRWATPEEQSNNKSDNVIITFNGRSQTISMWAKEIDIHHSTLVNRIRKNWPLEKALTTRTKP